METRGGCYIDTWFCAVSLEDQSYLHRLSLDKSIVLSSMAAPRRASIMASISQYRLQQPIPRPLLIQAIRKITRTNTEHPRWHQLKYLWSHFSAAYGHKHPCYSMHRMSSIVRTFYASGSFAWISYREYSTPPDSILTHDNDCPLWTFQILRFDKYREQIR